MRSALVPLIAALSTSALPSVSNAQTFHKLYGGPEDDGVTKMVRTADGAFALLGFTESYGAGIKDAYLTKVDSMGAVLWRKTYGGIGNENVHAMSATDDGGFILCGSTTSYGPFAQNVLMIRLDANGDVLWAKGIGSWDDDTGNTVVQCDDGGFLVAGMTHGSMNSGHDMLLIRTDQGGDTLWTRVIGAVWTDVPRSLCKTNAGYVIAGTTSSFGPGFNDVLLMEIDDNGNQLWDRTYGGTAEDDCDAIIPTADGGFLLAGATSNFGVSTHSAYLIRTDALGDTLWTRAYDNGDYVYCATQSSDGGFLLGCSGSDFKVDSMGNLQWAMIHGPGTQPFTRSCLPLADGTFLLAGYCNNGPGFGEMEGRLIRIDAQGQSGCNELPAALLPMGTTTVFGNAAFSLFDLPLQTFAAPITVGAGGSSTTLCLALGEHALPPVAITIAPNPSPGRFTLQLDPATSGATVEVFDAQGRCLLLYGNGTKGPMALDLSGHPNGVYTAVVQADGRIHHYRLLLQH